MNTKYISINIYYLSINKCFSTLNEEIAKFFFDYRSMKCSVLDFKLISYDFLNYDFSCEETRLKNLMLFVSHEKKSTIFNFALAGKNYLAEYR